MLEFLKIIIIVITVFWLIKKIVFDWFEIISKEHWSDFLLHSNLDLIDLKNQILNFKSKIIEIWKKRSIKNVEDWVKNTVKEVKTEVNDYKKTKINDVVNREIILSILRDRNGVDGDNSFDERLWELYKTGRVRVKKIDIDRYKRQHVGPSTLPPPPPPPHPQRSNSDARVSESPGEGDHLNKVVERIPSTMVSSTHRNNTEFVRIGNNIARKTRVHTCEKCGWVGSVYECTGGKEYFVCVTCEKNDGN